MGFLIGFAPWIVYWILVGNTGFVAAVGIALALAVAGPLILRLRGRSWHSLEVGTAVMFALLLIAAFTVDDQVLERWLQPVTTLGLFLIALITALIGRPFVEEYAAESVDPQTAATDGFRVITVAMTWMWIAVFGVMTVSALIPPLVDGDATIRDTGHLLSVICYWVVPYTAMGAAGVVSALFPTWFARRSELVAAHTGDQRRPVAPTSAPAPIHSDSLVLTAPEVSRHDEPFAWSVRGCTPHASVEVHASGIDLVGAEWESAAIFTASAKGVVDPAITAPVTGDWSAPDADAVLWAMRFESDHTPELFLPPAYEWQVTIDIRCGSERLRTTVNRVPAPADVRLTEVSIAGRRAVYASPTGAPPPNGRPGVACFGGSEGGCDSQRATIAMLAANGYAALAFSWLDENTDIARVPLHRFVRAINWLAGQEEVDARRTAAMGISRGAEGLLATAAHSRISLSGLILVSPSSVSWQAIGSDGEIPGTPSWTLDGADLPWCALPSGELMPQLVRNAWSAHGNIAHHQPILLRLRPAYDEGLDHATPETELRSERIDYPILCLTGDDDAVWPSGTMADALLSRRSHPGDAHLRFSGAGHLIRPGIFPVAAQWTGGITFGGNGSGQAAAQRGASTAILGFLRRM
ncbi:acyl-CoA thioester hydrolase/BAAT C-terminal domain-containing protein [Nocardia cyriacigeorgica]|uniref:acyl-CoA thioester hydrolase/BAAT C-terminal domain-containing protein n=1 Tax=Nocardia cyriacigeorgica TaxID=135487 RepID=UPI002456CCBE|nr:acyl-CoA thioester hydrolase/BAAT C-terminal domain-containing protein [Nocardia cyriacigeorgica]